MAKECASALLDKLENNAVTMFIDALGRELTYILNKSLGHKTKSHSKRREKFSLSLGLLGLLNYGRIFLPVLSGQSSTRTHGLCKYLQD